MNPAGSPNNQILPCPFKEVLAPYLPNIRNDCLANGHVPVSFKHAMEIPFTRGHHSERSHMKTLVIALHRMLFLTQPATSGLQDHGTVHRVTTATQWGLTDEKTWRGLTYSKHLRSTESCPSCQRSWKFLTVTCFYIHDLIKVLKCSRVQSEHYWGMFNVHCSLQSLCCSDAVGGVVVKTT